VRFDCEKWPIRPDYDNWNYVNANDFRGYPQECTPEPESKLHRDGHGEQAVHGTLDYRVGKGDLSHVGRSAEWHN
jgi:hypothetical protein